jgi:DNA-binding transcriptional LysR family regulator
MDSLSGFVVFNRVAETRSFVAAGQSLGISASAVGKRVARLEGRLGVRLFHRSTRSITLTAEGALFSSAAGASSPKSRPPSRNCRRPAKPARAPAGEPAAGDRAGDAGTGRVHGAVPASNWTWTSDRMVDIVGEGFDVVMRGGQPVDSRLNAKFLGHFPAPPGGLARLPARAAHPAHPRELATHRCLHYRFPSNGKLETWPLRQEHPEHAYDIPISMVCNHVETRVCFALNHRGITCLPDFTVGRELGNWFSWSACSTTSWNGAAASTCCGRRAAYAAEACGCSSTSCSSGYSTVQVVDVLVGQRRYLAEQEVAQLVHLPRFWAGLEPGHVITVARGRHA